MSMTNITERVTTTPLTRVADDDAEVAVRRVETPKGSRLELEATESGERIRLDAVTLECLTWQEETTFAGFLETQNRPLPVEALSVHHGLEEGDSTELTRVTNEFGHAEVRASESPDHDWLAIVAPKQGFSVRLNAVALESITWQEQDAFAELIRERLEQ